MQQRDLNRAVSRATGESVSTIKRLGFLIAEPDDPHDPDSEEFGPYVIDWDAVERQRDSHPIEGRDDVPRIG